MKSEDINNCLVLIYNPENKKPLGTGFFVTEYGHFITAKHVIYDSVKNSARELCCRWKGVKYPICYINTLADSGFYRELKHSGSELRLDLIILKIDFTNPDFRTNYLSIISTDISDNLSSLQNLVCKGFPCETIDHIANIKKSHEFEFESVSYNERNCTYFSAQKNNGSNGSALEIPIGISGSPFVLKSTNEVVGVAVQRNKSKLGATLQSLHMLIDQIKARDSELYNLLVWSDLLYKSYHEAQSDSFKEEKDWLHAIDEKVFVEIFDFETYATIDKKEFEKEEGNCIPYIIKQLPKRNIFCIGYYGMGKTTIAKFLFSYYHKYSSTEYPFFLSLFNTKLDNINIESLDDLIIDNVREEIKAKYADENSVYISTERIRRFLKNNEITLILDGIDEAICDRHSLIDFFNLLEKLPYNYVLTSRKEFYAFFDIFKIQMADCHDHLIIELMEWGIKQWDVYIKNLRGKFPKQPQKQQRINHLKEVLDSKSYGELPKRPLFLKMIADIELDEQTSLKIPDDLKKNISAIYHAYIEWKIEYDWKEKGGGIHIDEGHFKEDTFVLFKKLAYTEYKKNVPSNGVLGLLNQDKTAVKNTSITTYGISLENIQNACKDLGSFDRDKITKYLHDSTFFSMIKRIDGNNIYRFSHKSFCEYLVGYNLAESIFKSNKCNDCWDLYQTYEVSEHFIKEMDRVRVINGLTKSQMKQHLLIAFEKVLAEQDDYNGYSEKLEEVLYYAGHYKIDSPQILQLLSSIIQGQPNVHQIYYRTAHLSLSMIGQSDACLKYIEELILSFYGDQKAFSLNLDIQQIYYGQTTLQSILKNEIDTFLNSEDFLDSKKLLGIIPLKIFSYFACVPFDNSEINTVSKYLRHLKSVCNENKFTRMLVILNKTEAIMNSINNENYTAKKNKYE